MPRPGTPLENDSQAIRPIDESGDRCPFLQEIRACSCAAASSSRLIPRTLLAVRRCLGDSHRYCEFFLERVRLHPPTGADGREIPIAPGVALAPNHMWLDVGPDGCCHVGLDAFMVRMLGAIDEVIFLSARGRGAPSLVLTIAGVTLPLVFPQPLDITCVNRAIRGHVDHLTADPYGRGWLYEGWPVASHGRTGPAARSSGLRRGADAETWMASEVSRLRQHVRTIASRRSSQLGPVWADGGEVAAGLAHHLERAELLEVFSLFFAGAA